MPLAQDEMKRKTPAVSDEPTDTMQTNSNDDDSNEQETRTDADSYVDSSRGNKDLKVLGAVVSLVAIIIVTIALIWKGPNGKEGNGRGIGLFRNPSPTDFPSNIPSFVPSDMPSLVPSDMPSLLPSTRPSASLVPSSAPTDSTQPTAIPTDVPSRSPSSQPTSSMNPTYFYEDFYVKPNRVPDNPPRGYFNYNRNDRTYGPDRWHLVNTEDHWLKEFSSEGWGPFEKHLKDKEPTLNRCDTETRHQSPKNMIETTPCDAGHEIRTRVSLMRKVKHHFIYNLFANISYCFLYFFFVKVSIIYN